jgi:hypothetical protein
MSALVAASYGAAAAQEGAPVVFSVASVHFEQNATDKDAEVVFEVKGGDDGLAKLSVVAPDGRTVLTFVAPDSSTLGMRQFRFESPEPLDVAALKSAYPEGIYVFEGATAAGVRLRGTAALNHRLPAPVSLTGRIAGAENVPVSNLEITWTPVKGLDAYLVYIEQADLDESITMKLPASAAAFRVPDGFLRPGTAYQLGIGTVTGHGNISFIETTFTTTNKP